MDVSVEKQGRQQHQADLHSRMKAGLGMGPAQEGDAKCQSRAMSSAQPSTKVNGGCNDPAGPTSPSEKSRLTYRTHTDSHEFHKTCMEDKDIKTGGVRVSRT